MSYQFELRHLRYFQAVAEELHFRKAAEKLFISQPGLSRQIKQLEDAVGVQLLSRDKKEVRLTAAGEFFKSEVDFILNHLDFTVEQVQLVDQGSVGEVRIGFLGSAMQNVVPDMLLKMNQHYPKIKTTLEEMSNYEQVQGIMKDELDIGFVRLARVPEGLEIMPVFTDSFSLVLPADHPITEENFENVAQLKDAQFILFTADYSNLYYDTIMSICEDQDFSPQVSHKTVHAQTIFKLVENNMGVSIVPTSLQHGYQLGVKFIELKHIPQQAVLSAIWRKNNRNPLLAKVCDLL
ncbi:LysR family transcriptional regulator [Persicobacter psychrovividus]|uniref:LysR family transcriptional regulator n=1 Tax=Persicobacter psychrovividus TaxID=387638 RepID=A0ABM7VHT9_9BACT|nr:LysR family transcriptional regulator [Persicobacter psychrovividus]